MLLAICSHVCTWVPTCTVIFLLFFGYNVSEQVLVWIVDCYPSNKLSALSNSIKIDLFLCNFSKVINSGYGAQSTIKKCLPPSRGLTPYISPHPPPTSPTTFFWCLRPNTLPNPPTTHSTYPTQPPPRKKLHTRYFIHVLLRSFLNNLIIYNGKNIFEFSTDT